MLVSGSRHRSNSATTAAAPIGRRPGSFSSSRPTSIVSRGGLWAPRGGGGEVSVAIATSSPELPVNGGRPSISSNRIRPRLKRSDEGPIVFCPRSCSGLMKPGVPISSPVLVISVSPAHANFAMPKSRTFTATRPSGRSVTTMLRGLRSRCVTPVRCAASSATAICRATSTTTSNARRDAIHRRRVTPSTYSVTAKGVASWTPDAMSRTQSGWSRRCRVVTSRSKRSCSTWESRERNFTATSAPVVRSVARQTVANPPSPIASISRKRCATRLAGTRSAMTAAYVTASYYDNARKR